MPVIDAHVHLYPNEINRDPVGWAARSGEHHWAKLCTRVRKDGRPVQDFPDVEGLVRAMDEAGVDVAVLLGWYWEQGEHARWQNRFFAECVKRHPARLAAFAAVHPRWSRTELEAEVSWAKENGMVGLGELSPHAQGVALDSDGWTRILRLAAEASLPINLHVTEPDGRGYPGKVDTPLEELVRMMEANSEVTFILAHWGGRLHAREGWAARMLACGNVFLDTAASPLIYPPAIAREMVDAAGAERVLWGTDFPLRLYPASGDAAEMKLHLAEMKRELSGHPALPQILGGNASRLFRL